MPNQKTVVGFVGLDKLGLRLASSLIRSGYHVQAYQEDSSYVNDFCNLGGARCQTPVEATRDATVAILANVGDDIADISSTIGGLGKGTTVIIGSQLSPSHLQNIEKKVSEMEDVTLLDAYIFEGYAEALDRDIIVVASGKKHALERGEQFLSALTDKVYYFENEVGIGSKIKLVNDLLECIHLVASVEATFLGARAGLHPSILYDIISNAAGSSRVFVEMVPKLLADDSLLIDYMNSLLKDVNSVMDGAKAVKFPLPLLAVAYQQLINGCSMKVGGELSPSPTKAYEQIYGMNIRDAMNQPSYDPSELAQELTATAKGVQKIGFIGLGAMGFGMASHLLKSGFSVIAYDVYKPTLVKFAELGGLIGTSPQEISQEVQVLLIMVATEAQAESVLYGDTGALSTVPVGTSIILCSTVSPGYVTLLEQRLKDGSKDLKLIDAPVSGGVIRAADGTLTIMASGTNEALQSCGYVLSALSEKLYIIKGGCGAASSVKMVNQLLAGVHIASSAEAIAFGARLGIGTRKLFEILQHSRGYSWMFGNRVPHMLESDYKPYSAIDIFVKDLGIVCNESSKVKIPVHVSSIAHQLFISGSASGWGRYDDSAVVKVYETLTGVKVEGKHAILSKTDVLNSLPSEFGENPMENQDIIGNLNSKVLVVLDDDPTGTQTVHDIQVLTEWSTETLVEQFGKKPTCFFILTNSRALSSDKAVSLTKEICKNLEAAAKQVAGTSYTVVLRGDSTLRGHFPEEADAAVSVLGEMDAWIICPFFLQGGRYTIHDIHYVADSDRLIPAGETEFAKDASFGYKSSNLKEWVEEKTKGRVLASSVSSISIDHLRKEGPDSVCKHLCNLKKAERKGKRFLCRTAASFVSARIGIIPKPPLQPKDLGIKRDSCGGLIVVGSYVPKTTKQVEELLSQFSANLKIIEISVDNVSMKSLEEREEEIYCASEMASASIRAFKDTLIITSRKLITGKSPEESLEINYKVSSALVDIIRRIDARPRYIIAKGGITSSDLATKALNAKCATVIGQALPGVPLWQLGPESKHPSVPYIVFPGNVGDNEALAKVAKTWAQPPRCSTKELLDNAEKGGYAIGAFNVYNMEGVEAVISAAETANSPAILQIHPGSLKEGGLPLISCCLAAADRARVPITVHYDHGNSKSDLLDALELGFDSVMADGSYLPLDENISFTKFISSLAHEKGILVEAELGRLSGTEDGLTVEEYEAKLTDVAQASKFMDETNIDALAVCIGNVHGKYPLGGPNLRLDLLKELRQLTMKKGVSLVLHGASGLSRDLVEECINLGVRKFNVNTEVRSAYLESLKKPQKDLVQVMASAKEAMKVIISEKMHLFGSAGKA
ncbi:ketose-bisphosphate aldolase class-II family protein isoform X2 [Carex rostrata]